MSTKLNVAILVYPGVEMIDMNGPADVFLKANNLNKGKYQIFTLAETPEPLCSEASLVKITPTYTLDNCPKIRINLAAVRMCSLPGCKKWPLNLK